MKDFKEGDYLKTSFGTIIKLLELDTLNGIHNKIAYSNGDNGVAFNGFLQQCNKWKPLIGEYCCFCDFEDDYFVVARFKLVREIGEERMGYETMDGVVYNRVAPFGFPVEVILEKEIRWKY